MRFLRMCDADRAPSLGCGTLSSRLQSMRTARWGGVKTPRPPNAGPSERRRESSRPDLEACRRSCTLDRRDSLLGTGQRDGKDRIGPLHLRGGREHRLRCLQERSDRQEAGRGGAHQLHGNMDARPKSGGQSSVELKLAGGKDQSHEKCVDDAVGNSGPGTLTLTSCLERADPRPTGRPGANGFPG